MDSLRISTDWKGGGFLIGHIGGFHLQHPVLRQTDVLCIGTQLETAPRKDLVAVLKAGYGLGLLFQFPRPVPGLISLFWSASAVRSRAAGAARIC